MSEQSAQPSIASKSVGVVTGKVKWFSDRKGYGFITIKSVAPDSKTEGVLVGMDMFVYYKDIYPISCHIKTLRVGEYVNLDIVQGIAGLQASNVTGIGGGTLMCDMNVFA